jgi:hypothetical protein
MSRRRLPLLEESRRRLDLARALADQTARALERSQSLMDSTAERLAVSRGSDYCFDAAQDHASARSGR